MNTDFWIRRPGLHRRQECAASQFLDTTPA